MIELSSAPDNGLVTYELLWPALSANRAKTSLRQCCVVNKWQAMKDFILKA